MLQPLLMSTLCVVKWRITFSVSMYIMCVLLCLFSALSRGVGALQISIIIVIEKEHFPFLQRFSYREHREPEWPSGTALGW